MTLTKQLSSSTTTISACRSLDDVFAGIIDQIAHDVKVPGRALTVLSLMQIPRIAKADDSISLVGLKEEVHSMAIKLREDMREFESDGGDWPTGIDRVSELVFGPLDSDTAEAIFGHLHYLRSYRQDSMAYALFHPKTGLPLAACTVSPLQWENLAQIILQRVGVPQAAVMDISRVYVFDQAPKNSISALLSRVRLDLRQNHPEVELLTTAVDQNLAFHGSSYKASNWQLFCEVQPRPYLYFDSDYMTIRQVREMFGEKHWKEIAELTDGRFEISEAPLLDSLIFIQRIRNDRIAIPDQVYRLERQGI